MPDTTRIVCWNIERNRTAIDRLPDFGADIALLQGVRSQDWEHLRKYSYWDQFFPSLPALQFFDPDFDWPAVVHLTKRYYAKPLIPVYPESLSKPDEFTHGSPGITAGARLLPGRGKPHISLISAHAKQMADASQPEGCLSPRNANREIQIYLSEYAFFHREQRPVIIAGDFNCEVLPANPKPWEIPNLYTMLRQADFHYCGPQVLAIPPDPAYQPNTAESAARVQPASPKRRHGQVFATPHFRGIISTSIVEIDDPAVAHHPVLIELNT